ncbi:MAG TPA: hypothetical protein VIH19_03425 [Candidatus Limnocylindria bacterium]|jgi:hypothetical protein
MTAHEISNEPRSRRALLGGLLGGLGVWAASAIGRANPARAVDGEPVLVGGEYMANSVTWITNPSGPAIWGLSTSGPGVHGTSSSSIGVEGNSSSSVGVRGTSDYNVGVQGHSGGSFGVLGGSASTTRPAVVGLSNGGNTGVQGFSGAGDRPTARANTGVYGVAYQDATSKGVLGRSTAGHGIHGEAEAGWAGYFDGRLFVSRYVDIAEGPTPVTPTANRARLFVRENASHHTQLCVRFPNGIVRILGTA